jgi:putative flavoprotein involved in K+ transport
MATHITQAATSSAPADLISIRGYPGPGALLEQGAAFMALEGERIEAGGQNDQSAGARKAERRERFDVVVIGGGQAGLSAGYHLKRLGVNFVILEAGERIGDSWRKRWDSLRLFTPAMFDALDGMPFPADPYSFPTKVEMADYLEAYAARFELPVRTRMRVTELNREAGRYLVRAGGSRFEAAQVIVAAASYQKPHAPDFAAELDPDIVQLHSAEYHNPRQLRLGSVLLVGAGNSGAEIARELAPKHHHVFLAGPEVGHLPFNIEGFLARHGLLRLVLRGVFHRLLTVRTPPGRKVREQVLAGHSGPLVRVRPRDLTAAGVERVPRVAGVTSGKPRLQDGRVLAVENVIWCTGFRPGLEWIRLPIFDERGHPKHEDGIVHGEPGLGFVGLHFQHSLSSGMIHGVGRDARKVAEAAARRIARTAKAAA